MAEKRQPSNIAWRYVTFPNGGTFEYRDLKHAEVGRIWARAWSVYLQQNPDAKIGFAAFAHGVNILKNVRRDARGKRVRSHSNSYGEVVYQHMVRGTLPKDPVKRAIVEKLASQYIFPE